MIISNANQEKLSRQHFGFSEWFSESQWYDAYLNSNEQVGQQIVESAATEFVAAADGAINYGIVKTIVDNYIRN